jgi:hypothetical protein
LAKTPGFGAKRFSVVFVYIVVVAHARTGEANELPPDHIDISTVNWVTEHSFDGLLAQKREK